MEIKGRLLVRNNAIYIDDGHGHEIPILTWMVSFGVRVGNKILVKVEIEK